MECLILSQAPQGRRVCLYAVPDGVPIYFKHNELMSEPDYRPLWRGAPHNIPESEAAQWVARHTAGSSLFRNYLDAKNPNAGLDTAHASFQSAVACLSKQLEYSPGMFPTEVLVGETA